MARGGSQVSRVVHRSVLSEVSFWNLSQLHQKVSGLARRAANALRLGSTIDQGESLLSGSDVVSSANWGKQKCELGETTEGTPGHYHLSTGNNRNVSLTKRHRGILLTSGTFGIIVAGDNLHQNQYQTGQPLCLSFPTTLQD